MFIDKIIRMVIVLIFSAAFCLIFLTPTPHLLDVIIVLIIANLIVPEIDENRASKILRDAKNDLDKLKTERKLESINDQIIKATEDAKKILEELEASKTK